VARVILPDFLSRYAGAVSEHVVAALTVRGALAELVNRHEGFGPRLLDPAGGLPGHLLLTVNGDGLRPDDLDRALADADVLEIVPALVGGGADDVRMRGFRVRTPVAEARAISLADAAALPAEDVALEAAAGRVLAEDAVSGVAVPPCRRSAMDGYAVRAEDTFGATLMAPLPLTLIGESMPGRECTLDVGAGRACRIMTGAPVPAGADAVLPAESAREDGDVVQATGPVTPGKNVGAVGEDIRQDDVVLRRGRRLRPQDIGVLASIGRGRVRVVRRPRVRILVTGDELLAPGETPHGVRIVDSNSPMLRALVERDGGEVVERLHVRDDAAALTQALALAGADVLITTGATSVGREDVLPILVAELGRLLVHGIAMRPAAPTGLGRIGDTRVFLLPGNPVSCLSAYDFFAGPLIRVLAGLPADWPYGCTRLPLAERITSALGRADYVRVRIGPGGVVPIATSGASVLTSTTRADGFVVVGAESEGDSERTDVDVHLYDAWTFGLDANRRS